MTTSLTFTHLQFQARARQNNAIRLGKYQGAERLRDALASVMLRSVCPETKRATIPSPEHAAICPACWLLAAQTDEKAVRRVYSFVGPQPPADVLAPNQDFHFTITLFGDGFRFLPYFVLAASAMGDTGVGTGRGKFEIVSIHAVNPLTGERQTVLAEGEKIVKPQSLPVSWEEARAAADKFPADEDIRIRYLSPTRLIESDSLIKAPDFGIFFRRLLERIDELDKQHSNGERRSQDEVIRLNQLASEARLVDQSTQWIELWGPSGRTGRSTPMSGFVGYAVYRSKHWKELLPFLLLGQGVQVGKLTAKGNGVFQVEGRAYWS
ncbi:MAG: CRISPR system precrRNA processing endoribonuclease RAMP protein Cas6 [Anaerolineales bacterium]|nr:CRISPR system precrRNA processing endoribonuclease RAMP protein Cas6 [Anaerolineales bacterium]